MPRKISQLPLQPAPPTTVELELNDSGVSKRTSLLNLLAATTTAYMAADAFLQSQITALSLSTVTSVSPNFTGIPTAPTAVPFTATTQIATTAFVTAATGLKLSTSGAVPMLGSLDMGTNQINNVVDGASGSQDAATVAQTEALFSKGGSYWVTYDPTATSMFPTSWGGDPIRKGHTFFMSLPGTMAAGTVTVGAGDVISAIVDLATNSAADWKVLQANTLAADTTTIGIIRTATNAEAISKGLVGVALTPSNLASLDATDTATGFAEIATQAEVDAEVDTVRYVTPATLANKVSSSGYNQFVGITNASFPTGTWGYIQTAAEIARRRTAAAATNSIFVDVTPAMISGGTAGFKLTSFDVLFRIGTAALGAHTVALYTLSYADNVPVTGAGVAITGTAPVDPSVNPRVSNFTVDFPAFLNDDRYTVEIMVTDLGTTVYDFIGLNLHFTKTL